MKKEMNKKRKCIHCKKVKPRTEFPKYSFAHQQACKPCIERNYQNGEFIQPGNRRGRYTPEFQDYVPNRDVYRRGQS